MLDAKFYRVFCVCERRETTLREYIVGICMLMYIWYDDMLVVWYDRMAVWMDAKGVIYAVMGKEGASGKSATTAFRRRRV